MLDSAQKTSVYCAKTTSTSDGHLEVVMEQDSKIPGTEDMPDISNCRVRRIDADMAECMVMAHCAYELPFGNLCTHPLASQIAEDGDSRPCR